MKDRDTRRLQVGQRIIIDTTGAEVEQGERGYIYELRGWNFEHGVKLSRWVVLWIDTRPNGQITRRCPCVDSKCFSVLNSQEVGQ